MSNVDDKAEAVRRWRDDNACTLDGQPAKIIGWNCDFPRVAHVSGPLSLQWSWATVNRIMSGDRKFKS
jgi:hypothetical protein